MPRTDYAASATGNHMLGGDGYVQPLTLYLALYSVAPTTAGGGTEVTGGSYARQTVEFTETATDGEFENDTATFNDMPEVDVVAIGVVDASSAGNLLYFEDFTAESVAAEETYHVPAGTLVIQF
jgi:hypothetical protein